MKRALLLLLSLLLISCGDDDSSDAGADVSVGDVLPEGEVEVPDDTVTLVAQADGTQTGMAAVGEDGVARFYSESRQAFIQYTLAPGDDQTSMSPTTEVHVAVEPDGATSYFVWDPTHKTMPVAFSAMMPADGEFSMEVDPLEIEKMDSTILEYDEEPSTNPFGDFTVAGISVSISISGIVRGIAIGAIISTFGNLLRAGCGAVAPLHDDICEVIVQVAEGAAGFVVPGFKLAKGGLSLGGFGYKVFKKALTESCSVAGVAIGKAMNEDNQERTLALRTDYRRAVGEYHYLLYQLENNPPQDAGERAALETALVDIGVQLSAIGPQVREGYVEIFNTDLPQIADLAPHKRVIKATQRVIANTTFSEVVWKDFVFDRFSQALLGPLPNGGMVLVGVPDGKIQLTGKTLKQINTKVVGDLAGCFVTVWSEMSGVISDGLNEEAASLQMPVLYQQTVNVARAANQTLFDTYFGGGDIPVPCEFDEYEPNSTWQQAIASPNTVGVGSGPVWLRDLSLCAVDGTPIDEDWYAFPMAAIEFQVQARVREPENETFREMFVEGQDQDVCADIYYYGQVSELAGAPPERLYGNCDKVTDTWTGSAGVRRALGEAWSFILVNVRAGEGATKPMGYDLGFAE